MLLKITFLTEGFWAQITFERFDSAVKPNMILNIARFVENLVTSTYHTLKSELKLLGLMIKCACDLVIVFLNIFKGRLFNIQRFVVEYSIIIFL